MNQFQIKTNKLNLFQIKTPLIIILFALCNTAISQDRFLKKGNRYYEKYEYINAQDSYLKAYQKGFTSLELLEKLANSYYFNSQYKEASSWYNQLINTYGSETDSENYFKYSQTLKTLEHYKDANTILKQFSKLKPNDNRVRLYLKQEDYLNKINNISNQFEIQNCAINTPFSDFGTSFYENKIIYSSTENYSEKSKDIYEWNQEPYLDLFIADYDSVNVQITQAVRWKNKLKGEFHESTAVFTNDGQTVYFTRNINNKGKQKRKTRNKLETDRLNIYSATKNKDGEWDNPIKLPFNMANYSTAHPALSQTENKLFFSSDIPGGFGQSDIYSVDIYPDGTFGIPENLGPSINTEGKENFSYISSDNELYFSSDGQMGLGGLDIFKVQLDKNSNLSEIFPVNNLGRPINTPYDDFALILDKINNQGFFSSNRIGGKGKDDIYSFRFNKDIQKTYKFEIGEDLALKLAINPIYFDLDKSFIRPDASLELNKILKVLKENPNIKILIKSHTDSRATYFYNIKLSDRRATSTLNYLIANGINPNRLTAFGYGETELTNKCSDGVPCSKDEHQANRRSEFIITHI